MPVFSIEARAFRVALAWSHNFWVLKDAERDVSIAELHGLAFDRIRKIVLPIGTNRDHALRMFVFVHDARYVPVVGPRVSVTRMFARSRASVAYRGEDGLDRWKAAVAALPMLEGLDLDYPPYGFNVLRPTVNSNSAYRTLGEIMDIPVPRFPGAFAPGAGQLMLPRSDIERLKYRKRNAQPAAPVDQTSIAS